MRTEMTPAVRFALRVARRVGVTLGGVFLMVVGLAGLVLPVLPGWLLIVAGLGLLATEYTWARRVVLVARRRAHEARLRARSRRSARRRPAAAGRPSGGRAASSRDGLGGGVVIELEDVIDLRDDDQIRRPGRDRLAR